MNQNNRAGPRNSTLSPPYRYQPEDVQYEVMSPVLNKQSLTGKHKKTNIPKSQNSNQGFLPVPGGVTPVMTNYQPNHASVQKQSNTDFGVPIKMRRSVAGGLSRNTLAGQNNEQNTQQFQQAVANTNKKTQLQIGQQTNQHNYMGSIMFGGFAQTDNRQANLPSIPVGGANTGTHLYGVPTAPSSFPKAQGGNIREDGGVQKTYYNINNWSTSELQALSEDAGNKIKAIRSIKVNKTSKSRVPKQINVTPNQSRLVQSPTGQFTQVNLRKSGECQVLQMQQLKIRPQNTIPLANKFSQKTSQTHISVDQRKHTTQSSNNTVFRHIDTNPQRIITAQQNTIHQRTGTLMEQYSDLNVINSSKNNVDIPDKISHYSSKIQPQPLKMGSQQNIREVNILIQKQQECLNQVIKAHQNELNMDESISKLNANNINTDISDPNNFHFSPASTPTRIEEGIAAEGNVVEANSAFGSNQAIKKFLNLIDLQNLIEKETRTNLQDPADFQKLQENQEFLANQVKQNPKVDPNLWKHFQSLLQLEQGSNLQQMSYSQRKTLADLRSQILSKSSAGLSTGEFGRTLKQFCDQINVDEAIVKPTYAYPKPVDPTNKLSHTQTVGFTGGFNKSNSRKIGGNMKTQQLMAQTSQNQSFEQQQAQLNKVNIALSPHVQQLRNAKNQTQQVLIKPQDEKVPPPTQKQQETEQPGSQPSNKVINIKKLNINIQQFQNNSAIGGISGSGLQQHLQNNLASLQQKQQQQRQQTSAMRNQQQNLPKQVQETLFIMDCQLLGLLESHDQLNLELQRQMPLGNDQQYHISEAEMVNFFMTRAQSAIASVFKQLPKLSEEAKVILNTIKAQQQVDFQQEIAKVDTLIIELEYSDYKNLLLQALFNNYGDRVLETLIHKISKETTDQKTFEMLETKSFQTITEFLSTIRKLHNQNDEIYKDEQKEESESSNSEKSEEGSEDLSRHLTYLFPKDYNKESGTFMNDVSNKVNFGVVVKNTKLYDALKQAEKMLRDQQQDTDQSLKKLSPFIVTRDCSFLRFMLFCSHAGIIKSAQYSLRRFFSNIFVVIKPGVRISSNGTQLNMTELPKIDLDKVTKYIATQLRKKQAHEHQLYQEAFRSSAQSHQHEISAVRKEIVPAQRKLVQLQHNKSTMSLNSYKSMKQLEGTKTFEIQSHFNSFLSSVKAEMIPTSGLQTTIKIYHQPYTHLNNSRIQRCFKIYNEFVLLTFKNRIIYSQAADNPSGPQDFTKVEANRICRLGCHMAIKDMPKRYSMLKQPLVEVFRNHRQLMKIKEQVIRFVHRILNEENNMTLAFSQIILMGQELPKQIERTKNKDADSNGLVLQNDNSMPPLNSIISPKQAQTIQKTYFYKYHVGYGNNHFLVKSVMKNRWWWHHGTQKDSVQNFDEAQMMWTQWCRDKLCNHLTTFQALQSEYKDILQKIDTKQLKEEKKSPEKEKEKEKKKMEKTSDFKLLKASNTPSKIEGREKSKKQNKKQILQLNQFNTTNDAPEEEKKEKNEKVLGKKKNKTQKNIVENSDSDKEDDVVIPKVKSKIESIKKHIQRVYNRLEFNQHLNNKKALFINMRNFYSYCCENEDVFDTLPLTFHVKNGVTDSQFINFKAYYQKEQALCDADSNRKNIWIIKPGENTNRGIGIKVEQELNKIIGLVEATKGQSSSNGSGRTVILQKYIDNPLLYNRRKFDVRCFALVTCHNGQMKAYFYRDGYIRTASKEFNMYNLGNKYIHLVNDAVQSHCEDYGRYEAANKLSYSDYQKYLNTDYKDLNINFERDLIIQVKKIVTDSIRATFHLLDPKKRLNSYELFGYDFMFDNNFKPYLIEVNSNPSLEVSCSLLAKIFTSMLDNTFRIALDPIFPPSTDGFASKKSAEGIEMCAENRFDLIFDERVDGPVLWEKIKNMSNEKHKEVKDLDDLEESEEEEELQQNVEKTPIPDKVLEKSEQKQKE